MPLRRAGRLAVRRRAGRRRRRMTWRGRLTLAALAATFLGLALAGSSDERAPAAAAPASAPPPLPEAPPALLRRLPPTARGVPLPILPERHGFETRPAPLTETVRLDAPGGSRSYELSYTLEPELARRVERILRRGRVAMGNVIVLEPGSGRVLAYAATDPTRLPPTRTYAAASLMKVVTAAATLEHAPEWASRPCRFRGSPYRLTRRRLDPPHRGRSVSFPRALITSNNQCFAQLAVHALGAPALLGEIGRFGLLDPPAPAHAPGSVAPVQDALALGRLGSGLAGCRITPLGAARLAALLATGRVVQPYWIDSVRDERGRELRLPRGKAQSVLAPPIAADLRAMLVGTTQRGTARHAFRSRGHRLRRAGVRVAGKTGSLTGVDPPGRYEWFIGVAPAEQPRVAVATFVVHGDLWWRNASELAAEVLQAALCPDGPCPGRGA